MKSHINLTVMLLHSAKNVADSHKSEKSKAHGIANGLYLTLPDFT